MKLRNWCDSSRAARLAGSDSRAICDLLESRVLFAAPAVTSFTLINADTDQPISGYSPMSSGTVLDLSTLPTKNLNVRADVSSETQSVRFGYDSNSNYRLESGAPFALASNNGPDYYAWTPTVGSHTITATPYSEKNGAGTVGAKSTLNFSVVSGTTSGTSIINLMVTDPFTREGDPADTGTVLVTRNGSLSSSLTVNFTVAGTAQEGVDYSTLPRKLTIPAGSASAAVTVKVLGDPTTEPAETVIISLASGSGYSIDAPGFGGIVTIAASDQPAPRPTFTATAKHAGTTGLQLNWTLPPSGTTSYRVTYTPGLYLPGTAGAMKSINVSAPASGISLANLEPNALYSINVTALGSAGVLGNAHVDAWTAIPSGVQRYLYSIDAPKERIGFRSLKPQIQVYDVSNGHKWVKNIPLPNIYNIRGVAGSVITNRLYISYHNSPVDGDAPGGLLCLNLATGALIWRKDYLESQIASPDRFDLTPDGKTIYMPVGESGTLRDWAIIDATNGNITGRVSHVSSPHNTIVSLDGRFAFLEGQEKGTQAADITHTVGVVDTATNQVVGKVGPFRDAVRPFTINGKASLVFATVNNFIGFQVGDVRTGKVWYTATPPGMPQPPVKALESYSHGIALTPDEKEVWVVDDGRAGFHVWDVSSVSTSAPKYVGFVQMRRQGRDLTGRTTSAASNDVARPPRWMVISYDGKYLYAEGGEIVDLGSKKVVGQLRGMQLNSSGQLVQSPYTHSRFILEVQLDNGTPVRVTNQFGVGRVR